MVSKTMDDFPDPETPVKIVICRFGMRRVTSRRLFSRAPLISMYSVMGASVPQDPARPCQVWIPGRRDEGPSGSEPSRADAEARRVRRPGLVALGIAPRPVLEVRQVRPGAQDADVGVPAGRPDVRLAVLVDEAAVPVGGQDRVLPVEDAGILEIALSVPGRPGGIAGDIAVAVTRVDVDAS